MKTSELTGPALVWAVAKCEGMNVLMARGGWFVFDSDAFPEYRNDYNDDKMQSFYPFTNWAQAGPIIEREGITVSKEDGCWSAYFRDNLFEDDGSEHWQTGLTPLIAAMRCFVSSKLGDDIEVPLELK